MNILILGAGGREHALAWAVQQNPKCDRLIVAPGNAGIAADRRMRRSRHPRWRPRWSPSAEERRSISSSSAPRRRWPPASPTLARARASLTFGPSAAAARLEASKAFTKEICDACGAPTAAWARFTDAAPARAYVTRQGAPIVIKADGLAAGKGVIVADDPATRRWPPSTTCSAGAFGAAGAEVVIEEFMDRRRGQLLRPLRRQQRPAHRHRAGPQARLRRRHRPQYRRHGRLFARPGPDRGDRRRRRWTRSSSPRCAEMARRGTPFQGVLYAGLMIEDGRARLVEYNVRFGDPGMPGADDAAGRPGARPACRPAPRAGWPSARVNWADDHALTVVMAAKGYPGAYDKGSVISGLDGMPEDSSHMVFHAGTGGEGWPDPRQRRPRAERHRPRRDAGRGAGRAPMRWSTGSTGPKASAAATSAGARFK